MSNVVAFDHPENPPRHLAPTIEIGMKRLQAMMKEPWREGSIEPGERTDALRQALELHEAHLAEKMGAEASEQEIGLLLEKLLAGYPAGRRQWSPDDLSMWFNTCMLELEGFPLWCIVKGFASSELKKVTGQVAFPPSAGELAESCANQLTPIVELRVAISQVLRAPEKSTKPIEESPEHRAAVAKKLWEDGLRPLMAPQESRAELKARKAAEHVTISRKMVENWNFHAGVEPERLETTLSTPELRGKLEGIRRDHSSVASELGGASRSAAGRPGADPGGEA